MMLRILPFVYLLLNMVHTHPEEKRDPKWFFPKRTLTTVVLQRRLITEMIPSSCAAIEPTLQPCRNVRRLDIRPSTPRRLKSTNAPEQPSEMLQYQIDNNKAPIEPSDDSGSWFWSGVTTVTQVLVSDVTVKKQDPNTVVTFSVKGCRPSQLPFDIPYCTDEITTNIINSTKTIPATLRTGDFHYIED